jgi:branched-chain amino acid transport system permease protein
VDAILTYVVNVVSLGGTYALLALGLAVVFSVLRLINFAHGELMTLAGYALLAGILLGVPFWAAVLAAVIVGGVAAVIMEATAFRPVRNANPATLLMTSFAVAMLLQVILQNFISARGQAVPVPSIFTGSIAIGNAQVSIIQAISIVVSLLSLIALKAFFDRSRSGWAIRAAADDFETVRLMGFKASRLIAIAFLISGLLAGIAGVLWVMQRGSVDPLMGLKPVLAAFVVVVIGGLGSLSGAVLGGYLLAAIEIALQTWLPEGLAPYRDALTFVLVIVVLSLFPNGLFGKRVAEKV